jgi:hypothetical protein
VRSLVIPDEDSPDVPPLLAIFGHLSETMMMAENG